MIKTYNFTDYVLLDAGDKEKLESINGIVLRRPDPMAIWPKTKPNIWNKCDAYYTRTNTGGGYWTFNNKLPESWTVKFNGLIFKVAPTSFKHTGLFPEQAANWEFIEEKLKGTKNKKILNLFAYTGAASLVALKQGTEVVHVDASKGINEWAKENRDLSKLTDKPIKFFVDDALKFLKREIRRGHKYDGIIMDPPSYGRGPNNELFKFEDQINPLIEACVELLSDDALFFIINTYTTGYSETVFRQTLESNLNNLKIKGTIISDEIGIPIKDSDYVLPCGFTTRWYR